MAHQSACQLPEPIGQESMNISIFFSNVTTYYPDKSSTVTHLKHQHAIAYIAKFYTTFHAASQMMMPILKFSVVL